MIVGTTLNTEERPLPQAFEGRASYRLYEDTSELTTLELQITETANKRYLVTIRRGKKVQSVSDATADAIARNLEAHISGKLDNDFKVVTEVA